MGSLLIDKNECDPLDDTGNKILTIYIIHFTSLLIFVPDQIQIYAFYCFFCFELGEYEIK